MEQEVILNSIVSKLIEEDDAIEQVISLGIINGKIDAEEVVDMDDEDMFKFLNESGYQFFAYHSLTQDFDGWVKMSDLDEVEKEFVEHVAIQ